MSNMPATLATPFSLSGPHRTAQAGPLAHRLTMVLLVCAIVALAVAGAVTSIILVSALVALAWIAVLVWRRPQWAAYLLAIGFPLIAGLARLSQSANLRPNELLLLFLLGLLVVRHIALRLPLPRLTWFDTAAMALILGGSIAPLLTLYGRGQSLTTDALIVLLGPLKNYAIYWMMRLALTHADHARRTIAVVLVTSGCLSVLGVAQALQISPVVHFLATYYPTKQVAGAGSVGRVTSVIGGWNDFAAYLCFVLLAAIAAAMARIRVLPSLLFNSLIALDVAALLLTGSIAGILGLVVGLVILGLVFGEGARVRRLLLVMIPAAALAAIAFAPLLAIRLNNQFGGGNHGVIPQSLVYRFYLWQTYFLPAIARHPLLGVSLTIPASIPWPTEDSGYLYLLFRGGVVYLLCYGCFTWCCFRGARVLVHSLRQWRSRHESMPAAAIGAAGTAPMPELGTCAIAPAMGAAGLSMVAILLGMNVSEAYFTYTAAASILWMVLAIAAQRANGLAKKEVIDHAASSRWV